MQDIAARVGVAHIVEGSVRRSGERLRVTAQLVRAADGFHLWSENFDSSEEDTIAVQEEIAEKIAVALDVVLDDTKREVMSRAGLRDVEAFVELQKGVEWFERAHGEADQLGALRQANRHFETVIARVPDYPRAYVLHSDLYIHLLLNDASGQPLDEFGAVEIATAGGPDRCRPAGGRGPRAQPAGAQRHGLRPRLPVFGLARHACAHRAVCRRARLQRPDLNPQHRRAIRLRRAAERPLPGPL